MKQRMPRRAWSAPRHPGQRPRVLIEDDHPALVLSDFSLFEDAGFDVAYCSGPGCARADCPVLRGGQCELLASADVVLHRLDPGLGVAAAIRRRHPHLPVVAEQRRRPDGSLEPVAEGCDPLPPDCSVPGQIRALRRALATPPVAGAHAGRRG